MDPKLSLNPICQNLGLDKFSIAKAMRADEIFEDVKVMIDAVVDFLG